MSLLKLKNKSHPYFIYALISILLTASVLKFHNLRENFPFTMDEEYQAFLVKNIFTNHHLPLIGVNVSDLGIYLGPFFTWFAAIPLALANFHPIGWAIAAAVISITTALTAGWGAYIITKAQKDTTAFQQSAAAFLAGILYAVNPLLNLYDRKFWNPTFVPLLTIIWLIAIIKLKKDQRWLIALSLIFGLALHTHYSLFLLAPATIWYLFKYKIITFNKPTFKTKALNKLRSLSIFKRQPFVSYFKDPKLASALILLFSVLPLIAFELRHNFIQLRSLLNNLNLPTEISQSPIEKIGVLTAAINRFFFLKPHADIATEITNCAHLVKSTPEVPVGFIILVLLAILYRNKTFIEVAKVVTVTLATVIIGILIYRGPVLEYYLLPLLALFPIVIALTAVLKFNLDKNKRVENISILLILAVLILNWIYQSFTLTNHLGLGVKERVLSEAQGYIGSTPYHLEAEGTCFRFEGYRYIAESIGFAPTSSYMDPYFDWLYGKSPEASVKTELTISAQYDLGSKKYQIKAEPRGTWELERALETLNIRIVKQ